MNNKEKLFSQSEDINTKKPNKSKLDIWKVLGVDFYQDYILPTNPGSKNTLWKNIKSKLPGPSYDLKHDGIETRIKLSYKLQKDHIEIGIICGIIGYFTDPIVFGVLNLLVNIYPILVQIRTRVRLQKVLKYKNLKTKLPQKINLPKI